MFTSKQAKIFVGSFVACVAALTVAAGGAMAQDSGPKSDGCGCCKDMKMGQMKQPSAQTGK